MVDSAVNLTINIGTQGASNFAGMLKNMAAQSAQLATNLRSLSSYTLHSATSYRTLTESGQRSGRDAYRKKFEVGGGNIAGPDAPLTASQLIQRGLNAAPEIRDKTPQLTLGQRVGEAFGDLNETLQAVSRSATVLGASLTALVVSGIHASSAGQVIAFEWEKLSRQMAGLFRPEIQKFIEVLRAMQRWISSLTAIEKESLAHTLLFIGGLAALRFVLPLVTAGIMGLTAALTFLAAHPIMAALTAFGLLAGSLVGWKNVAKGTVTAMGWVKQQLEDQHRMQVQATFWSRHRFWPEKTEREAREFAAQHGYNPFTRQNLSSDMLDRVRKAVGLPPLPSRDTLPRRVPGVEALEATYERLSAASVNVGTEAVENDSAVLREIRDNVGDDGPIKRGLDEIKPGGVRG